MCMRNVFNARLCDLFNAQFIVTRFIVVQADPQDRLVCST